MYQQQQTEGLQLIGYGSHVPHLVCNRSWSLNSARWALRAVSFATSSCSLLMRYSCPKVIPARCDVLRLNAFLRQHAMLYLTWHCLALCVALLCFQQQGERSLLSGIKPE